MSHSTSSQSALKSAQAQEMQQKAIQHCTILIAYQYENIILLYTHKYFSRFWFNCGKCPSDTHTIDIQGSSHAHFVAFIARISLKKGTNRWRFDIFCWFFLTNRVFPYPRKIYTYRIVNEHHLKHPKFEG